MAFYEVTFIARQDLTQADIDRLTQEFSDIVKENKGKVVKSEYWGLRTLAYLINKSRKGHYVMLGLDAPAAAVKELERKLGLHEDVMRALTVRVNEISKEPSAVLQNNDINLSTDDEGGYGANYA